MTTKKRTTTRTKRVTTEIPLVAVCLFAGTPNKEYHYLIPKGVKAAAGDWGIVDTSGTSGSSYNYGERTYDVKTVKIVRVIDDIAQARKFLVGVLSANLVSETALRNQEFAGELRKIQAAKTALERLLKERADKDRYAALRNVPEAAEHLKVLGY